MYKITFNNNNRTHRVITIPCTIRELFPISIASIILVTLLTAVQVYVDSFFFTILRKVSIDMNVLLPRLFSVIDMSPSIGVIIASSLVSVHVIIGRGNANIVHVNGTMSVWLTVIDNGVTCNDGGSVNKERI